MEDTKVQPSDTLVDEWQSAIDDTKLDGIDVGETVVLGRPVDTFNRHSALGNLPRLDRDGRSSEFDLGDVLGEGGMGLVRLAHQKSLQRDVAIKTILPKLSDGETIRDLLQESWITGMLEHPNIVPVHALGVDEQGAPMLVMKHVEGKSWEEVLADDGSMPTAFRDGRDRLEAHLQILLQVCNAVQFSHSRDVIHCDLKPANIMLGDYGEVYLLDWGVAVSLDESHRGRLPTAAEVTELRGTPAYIAPELAAGEGEKIDARTDVYLLGAILHRIITGELRHVAPTVMATLIAAFKSEPYDYGDDVSPELAAICNRATAADREDRFESVQAFRRAIVDFLQHRESRRLSTEAMGRLRQMQTSMAAVSDGFEGDGQLRLERDEEVARIYRLFSECRFGFEQALNTWGENEPARRGLEEALRAMVEFELEQGDAKAAAVLMEDLPEEIPELDRRLEKLRQSLASEAAERERHRRISRDVDLSLASRQRAKMCVLLGFLFGGTPFIQYWLIGQGWASLEFTDYAVQYVAIVVGAGLVVGALRRRLFANAINARIIVSVFIILGGALIMRVLGFLLGLDPAGCIALENGLFAFGLAMLAVSIDWRLWPAAVAFLAGGVGGAMLPEYILPIDGASNAAALWAIAFVWR